MFSFYSASFPQYLLSVDNDIAQQKGVSIENAMNTLSTLIGSNYEISFIKFGRQYKVMVQAAAQYRALPEDVLKLYVKNEKDEMVPFSAFMKMEKVYGLSEITRHNMYNTAEISGAAGHGYSSGEAIKAINEVAKTALPRGYGIDWAGISADEVAQGNQAIYIFLICLGFVYLILAAQYESFVLPLAVILSLPVGIFGSFLLLKIFGLENNIYAQVAMVMLIGLLGKNAVLIVEFAVQKHRAGDFCIQGCHRRCQGAFPPYPDDFFRLYRGADSAGFRLRAGQDWEPDHRHSGCGRHAVRNRFRRAHHTGPLLRIRQDIRAEHHDKR